MSADFLTGMVLGQSMGGSSETIYKAYQNRCIRFILNKDFKINSYISQEIKKEYPGSSIKITQEKNKYTVFVSKPVNKNGWFGGSVEEESIFEAIYHYIQYPSFTIFIIVTLSEQGYIHCNNNALLVILFPELLKQSIDYTEKR